MAKKSVDSPITRREEAAARRHHKEIHVLEQRHADEVRRLEQKAVDAAFEAAKEKSESHNDLIAANERLASTFVTREFVDAMFKQVTSEIVPLRRLIYMGLGMAILFPVLVGLFLSLTQRR